MSEWRPIEEAPKDGHRVLVSGPHADMPGAWLTIAAWYMGAWHHDLPATRALSSEPTHFMPLPEPPR